MDVGQPKDYLTGKHLHDHPNPRDLPVPVPPHGDPLAPLDRPVQTQMGLRRQRPCRSCKLSRKPSLMQTAEVHETAVIGPNVVIGPGVKIQAGVRLQRAVILSNAVVREHAWVANSIVGWNSNVGRWVSSVCAFANPRPEWKTSRSSVTT